MSFKLNSEPVNTTKTIDFVRVASGISGHVCRTSAFPITKCKYLLVTSKPANQHHHTKCRNCIRNLHIFSHESCLFGPRPVFAHAKCFSIRFHRAPLALPQHQCWVNTVPVHGSCHAIQCVRQTSRDDARLSQLSLFCGLNRDIIKFCVHPPIKTQNYKLVHPKSERLSNALHKGQTQRFASRDIAVRSSKTTQRMWSN